MKKLLKEFKEFAMKGNVVDMAVGIIIGGAFGKIVSSFVADVIMPPLGLLIGHVDFSNLAITLRQATDGNEAVVLRIGQFLQTLFDFIIMAFHIFMMIKAMNMSRRKKEEAPAEAPKAPEPTAEEKLLTEIRDLLKKDATPKPAAKAVQTHGAKAPDRRKPSGNKPPQKKEDKK